MRRIDRQGASRWRRRAGFTLIEMLVVIAIIIALMALSASAVMKFLTVQQSNNTLTTMNKIQSVLNRQWAAVKDQAFKETIPTAIDTYIRNNLAGSDANVDGRVRVIYVKLKLRQVFPMNFNEAINPAPLPALPGYKNYLAQRGIGGSIPAPYESAVCLLMALQTSQGGGGTNNDTIGGGGSSKVFQLPNGQNIDGFVDAWGQPLYFTRVPAGYIPLNPNPFLPGPPPTYGGMPPPARSASNDQGDPQGYLNSQAWPKTANTNLFMSLTLQPLASGAANGQSFSYKLSPMLASGGPNKKLEVDPIWLSGIAFDDLFSNP